MKYAFMSFSCPELDAQGLAAEASRHGYDGVELRVAANHKHGAETDSDAAARRAIRGKFEKGGVAICCIATSCRYADPAAAEENVRETLRSIDLAADLGAPVIRVFGGGLGKGLSREDAIALVAKSLAAAAPRAAERGVTVCMETHDDWCDPANVAAVLRKVNHPAIAANWDIMHPVRTKLATMDSAFEVLKPWIRHIHFHDGATEDGKLVLKPIGEGEIDHRRAVQLLKSINYGGFLSGEWIGWEPYQTHLPRELAAMKRCEQEVRGV